jgi:hypothetical protein
MSEFPLFILFSKVTQGPLCTQMENHFLAPQGLYSSGTAMGKTTGGSFPDHRRSHLSEFYAFSIIYISLMRPAWSISLSNSFCVSTLAVCLPSSVFLRQIMDDFNSKKMTCMSSHLERMGPGR